MGIAMGSNSGSGGGAGTGLGLYQRGGGSHGSHSHSHSNSGSSSSSGKGQGMDSRRSSFDIEDALDIDDEELAGQWKGPLAHSNSLIPPKLS